MRTFLALPALLVCSTLLSPLNAAAFQAEINAISEDAVIDELAGASVGLEFLGEIRMLLEQAQTPLTEEQSAALLPLLESAPLQRGAVLSRDLPDEAGGIFTAEQTNALRRLDAARLLLAEGVTGLRRQLAAGNVPALTFDQETQIQSVWMDYQRVLNAMVAANGGSRDSIEPRIRALSEQLLLAALRFLNPAQRTAFAGSLTAADFAVLNSDLPEDEDELREYLADLRSPGSDDGGGGFGGGGIVVDGFGGGGRMPNRDEIQEIRINQNSFTAEQSNQQRGSTEIVTRGGTGRFNGDASFSFADESFDARNAFAATRPAYQRRDFNANVSGPVIRNRLTLALGVRDNKSENGDNLLAVTPNGLLTNAIVRPGVNRNYSTRGTAQLFENHVLNMSYSTGSQRDENNNVGGIRLPEQGHVSNRSNFNFQVQETAVLSSSINHEARFRVNDFSNENRGNNAAPHLHVQGSFRAGGSTEDNLFRNRNYEFGNLLMHTGEVVSLRTGFEGNFFRNTSDSRNNFNGTFTFTTLEDYLAGTPSKYEVNLGEPFQEVTQLQTATFLQSDWRVRPELTLSFGVRYEHQTNLSDRNNFAPRLGFAYSLGRGTVIRGGSGVFHRRLEIFAVNQLTRLDGTRQRFLEIQNPSYPDPFQEGESALNIPSTVRVRADDLATPYTWNSEVSLETTLQGGLALTSSYRYVRGVKLFRSRDLNAPLPGCMAAMPGGLTNAERYEFARLCQPDPLRGNLEQFESTGNSVDHNFRVGFRQRLSFLNLNGSYSYNVSYDDVWGDFGQPADNYDLDAEWARSGQRHSVDTTFNVRLPFNVNADTILNWRGAQPYTIRTGRDDNFDGAFNDRPAGVPRNSLDGPGFFEVGLNFSKAIQLRSDRVEGGEGPLGGGGYYGQRTGLRMTLSARVNNLLNTVNYQSYGGVQSSSLFGLPTSAREARSIQLSTRFNF